MPRINQASRPMPAGTVARASISIICDARRIVFILTSRKTVKWLSIGAITQYTAPTCRTGWRMNLAGTVQLVNPVEKLRYSWIRITKNGTKGHNHHKKPINHLTNDNCKITRNYAAGDGYFQRPVDHLAPDKCKITKANDVDLAQ